MSALIDYVLAHTARGACQCGQCFDAPASPEQHQPAGHTVDLYFFQVAAQGEPDKEEFVRLVKEHRGAFNDVDLFDGKEHGYMELGGWIGDQGLAMQCMGLGELLGVWGVMTPKVLPIPKDLQDQWAGSGLVTTAPLETVRSLRARAARMAAKAGAS